MMYESDVESFYEKAILWLIVLIAYCGFIILYYKNNKGIHIYIYYVITLEQ